MDPSRCCCAESKPEFLMASDCSDDNSLADTHSRSSTTAVASSESYGHGSHVHIVENVMRGPDCFSVASLDDQNKKRCLDGATEDARQGTKM